MPEKEILILSDKLTLPTPELLSSILGEKSLWWDQIVNSVKADYKEVSEVWRYYNDGKQWLFRLMQKKKTICWIGVLKDTFKVSFYFGDKAEILIENSDLPDPVKNSFATAKRYNNFRGLSITMKEDKDIEIVLKLVAVKMKLK